MPRKNRIIYEGAIYHIYQRGNNKEHIFEEDSVKTFLLRWLYEYNKKFDYEILAYAIMNNHYHLLIKTNKVPISQIMFYLNNLVGKYVKDKLDRTGHAFDGRYRSRLVETDAYLIWLLRYIHRNPIKANICSKLDDYRWSSHHYYKNNMRSNINIDFILDRLGDNREVAHRRYLGIVNSEGDKNDNDKDYAIIKGMFDLEENAFSNIINVSSMQLMERRKTLDEILMSLNLSDYEMVEIRSGSRKQSLTALKIEIIKAALKEFYSLKEIANFLNAAPSTISKLLSRNKIV